MLRILINLIIYELAEIKRKGGGWSPVALVLDANFNNAVEIAVWAKTQFGVIYSLHQEQALPGGSCQMLQVQGRAKNTKWGGFR